MPELLVTPRAKVRRFAALRRRKGTDALLNGRGKDGLENGEPFRVITKAVADNLTGAREMSVVNLGVLIASADSRVFEFSPTDFAPYTDLLPPTEEDIVEWHKLEYFLTHVTWEDEGPDTLTILAYGIRIIQGIPPV